MPNPLALIPPEIERWRQGNVGIEFVHRREAATAGPRVLVTAIVHGNEACGAAALDRLLAAGFTPRRGSATLAFANAAAYARIDPRHQDRGRFVDEDMNRVWSPARLEGREHSLELARARLLRPLVDAADYLLDLHSMTESDTPLALSGMTAKGMRLARRVGYPATVVADPGHAGGVRLRDYGAFGEAGGERAALLVECGRHFDAQSAEVAFETLLRFLGALDMLDPAFAAAQLPAKPPPAQRFIEVTHVVTIETDRFTFVRPCRTLEPIARG
ncbi:MAG: succinylglutamate desuccinylase/aspartoacylase family protein, partial [Alphaproteobacteria bacterium]